MLKFNTELGRWGGEFDNTIMSNSNKIKYYFKTMLFFSSLFLLSSCTQNKSKSNGKSTEELIMEMGTPVEIRTEVCGVCRGTGKTKCKECEGVGTIYRLDTKTIRNRHMDCSNCDGFGYFICSNCGGGGVVKVLRDK